jgi:hypothetical protein
MIKHSFSGVSLIGAVLIFLSSIGGCAKLVSKCARTSDAASHIASGAKNVENLEDLTLVEKNLSNLNKLFLSYRFIEVNKSIKMSLPEIAKKIDDPGGYDNIYLLKDEANHFFINTRSEPKSNTGLYEQWFKFKQIGLATKSILRLFAVYDSLNFTDNREGVQTKAYQYCPYNDTILGLVKLIETEEGFTFIEMETPKATAGFYEFSDSFFKTALQISTKGTENVTNSK